MTTPAENFKAEFPPSKRHCLACLILCLLGISDCSEQNIGKSNEVSPKNNTQADNATEKEGQDQIMALCARRWAVRNDSWFIRLDDLVEERRGKEHTFTSHTVFFQLKGINAAFTSEPVSEADKLNGIEFKIKAAISAAAMRQRVAGFSWSEWVDFKQVSYEVAYEKKNRKWSFVSEILKGFDFDISLMHKPTETELKEIE